MPKATKTKQTSAPRSAIGDVGVGIERGARAVLRTMGTLSEQLNAVDPDQQKGYAEGQAALEPLGGWEDVPGAATVRGMADSGREAVTRIGQRVAKQHAYYQKRVAEHGPFATDRETLRYAGEDIKEAADLKDVASVKELVDRLIALSGGQRGIRHLTLSSHGHTGYVMLEGGDVSLNVTATNYADTLAEFARLKPFMSLDGRVVLSGCLIARGLDGERLLHDLARAIGVPVTGFTAVVKMGTDRSKGLRRTRDPGQGWDPVDAAVSQVRAHVRRRSARTTYGGEGIPTWMQRALKSLQATKAACLRVEGRETWDTIVEVLENDGTMDHIRAGLNEANPGRVEMPNSTEVYNAGVVLYDALDLPSGPFVSQARDTRLDALGDMSVPDFY